MARKYNPHEVHPITYIFVVFMLLLTLAGIAPLFNNSSRDIRSSAQIAGAHPTATRTRTPTPQQACRQQGGYCVETCPGSSLIGGISSSLCTPTSNYPYCCRVANPCSGVPNRYGRCTNSCSGSSILRGDAEAYCQKNNYNYCCGAAPPASPTKTPTPQQACRQQGGYCVETCPGSSLIGGNSLCSGSSNYPLCCRVANPCSGVPGRYGRCTNSCTSSNRIGGQATDYCQRNNYSYCCGS